MNYPPPDRDARGARCARVSIDPSALARNLQQVRRFAAGSRVMAVIKANAYGHGVALASQALDRADAFALAMPGEAIALRDRGIRKTLVVLQGFADPEEIRLCAEQRLQPAIHSPWQVEMLEQTRGLQLDVWLKLDTGMHRFGIDAHRCDEMYQKLRACSCVGEIRLMSHLANADNPDMGSNARQLDTFIAATSSLDAERSLANSGGIVAMPASHMEWVRPGIMLYGSSPINTRSAAALGLEPAMQFESRIASVKTIRKGEAIGYGSTWTCPEDMPIGLVAAGYGDGYPRHAPAGTPVWVNGSTCSLVGRVSMDSLYIDLREVPAKAGDRVVLWGRELDVDRVAGHVDTIAYELFCHVGNAACPS